MEKLRLGGMLMLEMQTLRAFSSKPQPSLFTPHYRRLNAAFYLSNSAVSILFFLVNKCGILKIRKFIYCTTDVYG
jgi:hypothetical protein